MLENYERQNSYVALPTSSLELQSPLDVQNVIKVNVRNKKPNKQLKHVDSGKDDLRNLD